MELLFTGILSEDFHALQISKVKAFLDLALILVHDKDDAVKTVLAIA